MTSLPRQRLPDVWMLGLACGPALGQTVRAGDAAWTASQQSDTRGVVDGAWTVRVTATPHHRERGSRRADRTILDHLPRPQPDPAQAVPLTAARTAFSASAVTGDTTAS